MMNTRHSVQTRSEAQSCEFGATTAASPSLRSCRSLLGQVQDVKNSLLREFDSAQREHGQMLRLALNEAEALAWQTPYPHLLFPVLAYEKAESTRQWAQRQRDVRRATWSFVE